MLQLIVNGRRGAFVPMAAWRSSFSSAAQVCRAWCPDIMTRNMSTFVSSSLVWEHAGGTAGSDSLFIFRSICRQTAAQREPLLEHHDLMAAPIGNGTISRRPL